MKEEKVRVKIKEDGTVNVEVLGVKGKDCIAMTQGLEEALGVVTKRTKKQEYHERPARQTTQRVSRVHRGGR